MSARLAKPGAPGRAPPRRCYSFSAADKQQVWQLRMVEKVNAADTAHIMCRSVASIQNELRRLKEAHADAALKIANPRAKHRNCLRCATQFLSQHNGNRMCDDCRDTAQKTASPYESDEVSTGSRKPAHGFAHIFIPAFAEVAVTEGEMFVAGACGVRRDPSDVIGKVGHKRSKARD